MTPSIYLLRHAKSDWAAGPEPDLDRTLTKRGRKAAKRVGRWLTEHEEAPDHVLVSPAVRARETVRLAVAHGAWEAPIELADVLYGGTVEDVLASIAAVPPTTARLLLCGHQPLLGELLRRLVGGGNDPVFPTATLARIDAGRLVWLLPPRLLG
ncbi:MAG: histidine phosphatase family protein [Planctomycetota bacterium]